MSTISNFDCILLSIIILSCALSFFKGFIRSSLSFICFIASLILAYLLYPVVRKVLSTQIQHEVLLNTISITGSYIITLSVTSLVYNKFNNITKALQGGIVDRSMGFAFGIFRAMVIISIACWVIYVSSPILGLNKDTLKHEPKFSKEDRQYPIWVVKSKSFGLVKLGEKLTKTIVPDKISEAIEGYTEMHNKVEAVHEEKINHEETTINESQNKTPKEEEDIVFN